MTSYSEQSPHHGPITLRGPVVLDPPNTKPENSITAAMQTLQEREKKKKQAEEEQRIHPGESKVTMQMNGTIVEKWRHLPEDGASVPGKLSQPNRPPPRPITAASVPPYRIPDPSIYAQPGGKKPGAGGGVAAPAAHGVPGAATSAVIGGLAGVAAGSLAYSLHERSDGDEGDEMRGPDATFNIGDNSSHFVQQNITIVQAAPANPGPSVVATDNDADENRDEDDTNEYDEYDNADQGVDFGRDVQVIDRTEKITYPNGVVSEVHTTTTTSTSALNAYTGDEDDEEDAAQEDQDGQDDDNQDIDRGQQYEHAEEPRDIAIETHYSIQSEITGHPQAPDEDDVPLPPEIATTGGDVEVYDSNDGAIDFQDDSDDQDEDDDGHDDGNNTEAVENAQNEQTAQVAAQPQYDENNQKSDQDNDDDSDEESNFGGDDGYSFD